MGLGARSAVVAVILLAVRFGGDRYHPAMVFNGAILLSLGAGVVFAAAVALGRNLTPFPKPSEKARLVQHGIFSLIRHPLYTGVMLVSLGWAQVWQSWPALLMALALIPFSTPKLVGRNTGFGKGSPSISITSGA